MAEVAFCAAAMAGVASAMITSGLSEITSEMSPGNRAYRPFASRRSILRFLPSSYPLLASEVRINPRILSPRADVTSATRQVLAGSALARPPARMKQAEPIARNSRRLIQSPRWQSESAGDAQPLPASDIQSDQTATNKDVSDFGQGGVRNPSDTAGALDPAIPAAGALDLYPSLGATTAAGFDALGTHLGSG
jgi:hypothetical protein